MLLRKIWRAGLILFILLLIWTIYVQWKIQSVQNSSLPEHIEVGIVLGAALWENEPSPALKERLNRALELYERGVIPNLIVSGGMDVNRATITEAEGMKNYLVKKGVPEQHIITENESRNTYENLAYSKLKMEEHGWGNAVIITHAYHGARALDIATFVGYDQPAVSLMDSKVMWMPWHKGRETLAYGKWQLDKWMLRFGFKTAVK